MTATEINQRAGELAEQLNNSFGRLINEFLYPLIRRIVEVLQNFGYIDVDLDVSSFNGFGYKIVVNTALARQQKASELNNLLQFLQVSSAFDPTMQYISKVVDMNELAVEVARLSGVPTKFIRTAEEIKSLQEQEAQSMAMMQQQQMADQVVMSNAIEKGKADAKRNI